MASTRTIAAILGLGTIILIASLAYSLERRERIHRAVATLNDWSKSTEEQRSAIHVLSGYKSNESTDALINTALEPHSRQDTREMALSALSEVNDPKVSQALSELLQPFNALARREQTANLLIEKDSCSVVWIRNILHYLERIWWGEKPSTFTARQSEQALLEFTDKEQKFQAALASILVKRRFQTIVELQRVYGLGSAHPSPFALHLVAELGFSEACPQLTRQYLRELSDDRTRIELDVALEKLKCANTQVR